MHYKVKFLTYFLLGFSIITPAQSFDTKQVQKIDINCFVQDEQSYIKDKSKSEFFSGLNVGERFQKIHDGSMEKHFSKTFNEVNAIKKENPEPNFFTGMSIQEKFQKLYDGSFEKYYSKSHDLSKKESYLQNSKLGKANATNCQNSLSAEQKSISVSEKMQLIREGTFEQRVFGK